MENIAHPPGSADAPPPVNQLQGLPAAPQHAAASQGAGPVSVDKTPPPASSRHPSAPAEDGHPRHAAETWGAPPPAPAPQPVSV